MGQKLTERTELTSIASGDILHVVDVSDTTDSAEGTSKKITQDNLIPDASTTVKGKAVLVNGQINGSTSKTTPADADEIGITDSAASYALKKLTILGLKLAIYAGIKPAQGTMWNGRISVTVASNNITVALKTLAGTDPSASDPVYIMLAGAVRTITSALSLTVNAGANSFNAGSAELATKEIDYFSCLLWDTVGSAVRLGTTRFPGGAIYSDYSSTATNEKYLAISGGTPAATDEIAIIGRFAATLSAGAGYTWSVPTFTSINLIQRPIYETRLLAWVPTVTFTNPPTSATTVAKYQVKNNLVYWKYNITGTANAGNAGVNPRISTPFKGLSDAGGWPTVGQACWTDEATFTDGCTFFNWWGISTIQAQFSITTRKPTLFGMNGIFNI